MEKIKNALLTGLALMVIVFFVGGIVTGAAHCYLIAICALALGSSLYERRPKAKI